MMRFTPQCIAFCSLLTIVCSARLATAELILGVSADNGTTFATDFDVQVGDSLNLGIYLQQTGPNTILTDEGIVSWGFDLSRSPTDLGTISNASANTVFDFENHNVTTASGFEWEYADSSDFGLQGDAIFLGSFEFDATADGTSLFAIEDRIIGGGAFSANWFTPLFTDLDEQIFGTFATNQFQFSVNATAVPEPSSFILLGSVAGLLLGRRRRDA